MDEAKVAALPYGSETTLEEPYELHSSERRQPRAELHGHVRGTACKDAFAPAVRNRGVRSALASRAAASTTPSGAFSQVKLELGAGAVHGADLISATFMSSQ